MFNRFLSFILGKGPKVKKAKRRVDGALNMFAKAVRKIEQANEELAASISEDEETIERAEENKKRAEADLASNQTVLTKLTEFLPGR